MPARMRQAVLLAAASTDDYPRHGSSTADKCWDVQVSAVSGAAASSCCNLPITQCRDLVYWLKRRGARTPDTRRERCSMGGALSAGVPRGGAPPAEPHNKG